jgi:hypothetical protein
MKQIPIHGLLKGDSVRKLFGIKGALFALAVLAVLSGCAAPIKVATKPYSSGRILVLPPRDVVQNAVPHKVGVGSGQIFQKNLIANFEGSAFKVITTDSAEFSGTEIAPKEKVLAEAKRLNADFVLQSVLGEFQDAAPMTFRPDFVFVDKAAMYDVRTGESVWELSAPLYLQKGNIGSYQGLLEDHARSMVTSIQKNLK